MKTLPLFLTALLLAAGCARASDITINLDETTLTGGPGGILTFTGTITDNDSATVDLNELDVSLAGMFSVDNTPFLLGPPTVAAGETTVDFTLFTVTIDDPYTDPFGPVGGTVTILGGEEVDNVYESTAINPLGEADFTVNVAAAVPEVGTPWMVLPALALVFLLCRQRREGPCEASRPAA